MKIRQGQFKVIDGFAIRSRNEFYLIGQLNEGVVQENWFVNVPFNKSFSMTIRIVEINDIEVSNDGNKYKLLILSGNNETIDFLLGLKLGNEYMDITINGED